MGKPDNPNPRLRKADIRTGQRWHLNDNGDGDTGIRCTATGPI